MAKVLVTGASGFLALHIIGQLLSEGYSVIGTVRSQSKIEKLMSQFKTKYPEAVANLQFEIVPDIQLEGVFDKLFIEHKDIDFVLHTASPFSFGLEGSFDDVYLKPAVNGTLNVLKSIKNFASQVKKVVITSSMAAIDNMGDHELIHTEDIWNPLEWEQVNHEQLAYVASKNMLKNLPGILSKIMLNRSTSN